MTIDEFVESEVLPQYRDIVQLIRRDRRELAPDVQEVFSYSMPCYKANQILAYITSAKSGITFGFTRGKQFEDKYAMLRGTASLPGRMEKSIGSCMIPPLTKPRTK